MKDETDILKENDALKQQLAAAEGRVTVAESKLKAAEDRANAAEARASDAEAKAKAAESRAFDAEAKAKAAEDGVEARIAAAIAKAGVSASSAPKPPVSESKALNFTERLMAHLSAGK